MRQRLLVIGLDGYDPQIGEQLMGEGELPELARLKQCSAVLPLDHGGAKRTGLAWEHFATGLAPTDCDRYSAVDFDPINYRCTQRGTTLAPFTTAFSDSALIFDAPYFDLRRSPGTPGLVGWGAHDPGVPEHSYPTRLAGEVGRRFGPYPAKPWIYGHTWPSVERTVRMGRGLVDATRLRSDIAHWLLTERFSDWSLAVVVVSELHSAIEALWHGLDSAHPLGKLPSAAPARQATLDVYRAVDQLVGRLARSVPDAGHLVFNLHGMGPNQSDLASMALLPELLYRRQFGQSLMRDQSRNSETGLVMPPEDEAWSNSMRGCYPGERPVRKRKRSLLHSVFRDRAKRMLRPGRTSARISSINWMPATWYTRYWREMDVFALPSFYDGQIRVNLEGRESAGRVPLAAYQGTLARLEQTLRECRDPVTQQPMVRELLRAERANPLEMGDTEADLIVVWNASSDAMEHPQYGLIGPLPFRRPGGHTGGHGIAMLRGDVVVPGVYEERSAFDVVPTIFNWMESTPQSLVSGRSFLSLVSDRPQPC